MLGYMHFNLHKYSSSSDRGSTSHLLVDVHLKSLIVVELGASVVNLKEYDSHIIL